MSEQLQKKLANFPTTSGCYLMKGGSDTILYVGKANNLRSRVRSYFNFQSSGKPKDHGPKTAALVSKIVDVDFILTESEAEALVLENNLIKKHSPKYNILMRDDKSYPYIVIDYTKPFPRLSYTRKPQRKNNVEIFGPFAHGSNISQVLRIITKSFQLRDCSLREFKSRKEACLLYQIMQCSAPCVGYIEDEEYNTNLELAVDFFRGNADKSLGILEDRMLHAAEGEEFELAAIIRDYINILEDFIHTKQQKHAEIYSKYKSIDIVSYYQGDIETDISIYLIRNNILLGHKNFYIPNDNVEEDIEDNILNFLFQYYAKSNDSLPEVIISPFRAKVQKLFAQATASTTKIKVRTPKKEFKSFIKLTGDHAREQQVVRQTNKDKIQKGLEKLQKLLNMKTIPSKIECYDIAVFQGHSPTASQVVFTDGVPQKKLYRHYKLETREEGNNDFAMMKEVVARRIKHGQLPDLFIVDGGKGQVSSFSEVLRDENISIPVAGIAKAKTRKSDERLIIKGRANPYILNKFPPLLKILTHMRDEAHRFSRRLHHKHESSRIFTSWLDKVAGVGPKKKKNILAKLDIPNSTLVSMNVSEIRDYFDVNEKIANSMVEVIRDHFDTVKL